MLYMSILIPSSSCWIKTAPLDNKAEWTTYNERLRMILKGTQGYDNYSKNIPSSSKESGSTLGEKMGVRWRTP